MPRFTSSGEDNVSVSPPHTEKGEGWPTIRFGPAVLVHHSAQMFAEGFSTPTPGLGGGDPANQQLEDQSEAHSQLGSPLLLLGQFYSMPRLIFFAKKPEMGETGKIKIPTMESNRMFQTEIHPNF